VSRTYEQYCPVARALEVVGERWTVLIARELMLGPRRFTDLMFGLPGISSNVLAGRLKELEDAGIVSKRTLPPPAGSTVYELADDNEGLAHVLAAMAQWGMSLLGPTRDTDEIRGHWLVLGLAVTETLVGVRDATFELRIDDDVLEVRVEGGRMQPRYGAATDPDAVITTDAVTLADFTVGDVKVSRALATKRIIVEGDVTAARTFLESFRAARSHR
jgi:DNA-binding HxlR family transcriptional regulator